MKMKKKNKNKKMKKEIIVFDYKASYCYEATTRWGYTAVYKMNEIYYFGDKVKQ